MNRGLRDVFDRLPFSGSAYTSRQTQPNYTEIQWLYEKRKQTYTVKSKDSLDEFQIEKEKENIENKIHTQKLYFQK